MRLLFALIYICVGVWIYLWLGGSELHPFIGIAVGFALMFSSVIVCNEGFFRRIRGISDQEYIDQLLANGLAKLETYRVSAAITFEDLSTGCLCHILETGTDQAVCLYGQYLYDYAEISDDPDINQSRKFPTDNFKLVRRSKDGEVLRLDIGQNLIDEERIRIPDLTRLYDLGFRLEDGEVVSGVQFKKIRAACG